MFHQNNNARCRFFTAARKDQIEFEQGAVNPADVCRLPMFTCLTQRSLEPWRTGALERNPWIPGKVTRPAILAPILFIARIDLWIQTKTKRRILTRQTACYLFSIWIVETFMQELTLMSSIGYHGYYCLASWKCE